MSERSHKSEGSPVRRPAESVRIIGPEEAQAALEAGAATGRKPDDQLRFGDVPPVPEGPRPAHRFPLPDSVDPAGAVPLPPLAGAEQTGQGGGTDENPERAAASWEGQDDQDEWTTGDRTSELSVGEHGRNEAPAPHPQEGTEGITVTGPAAELPHWTDPPTGDVPRILPDAGMDDDPAEEDLDAWRALGSRGVRWRDGEDDWDESDAISDLAGDDEPVGALDQSRSEQSDLYSFDEDFERVTSRTGGSPTVTDYDNEMVSDPPAESVAPPTGPRHVRTTGTRSDTGWRGGPAGRPPGSPSGDSDAMASRVVVGAALVGLLIIAYVIGSKALVVLAAVAIVASAAEAYGMLQRAGFRPATLLGLVATVGIVFGAYWKGLAALPVVLVLLFVGSMMWYVLGIVEARPLANVAVTVMVFVWVGFLGAFGAVMLGARSGKGLFLGAVVVAVAADLVAFLIGRWIGSRPLAPSISPNKTVEGFIGGVIGALIVGAIVGKEVTPWGGMRHGLLLGLIVGLVAPAGDLFESMIKRDLGVKDSGNILPGHGGLLDRFDSILLALPAAYFVATFFHLVKP